jgi:hypothetical protein
MFLLLFFFTIMASSLHPPSMQNTPCPHCSNLYTLSSLSRYVKSAHPPASFLSQASQIVFSLQVSSFPMILPSFIPFVFRGWLQA